MSTLSAGAGLALLSLLLTVHGLPSTMKKGTLACTQYGVPCGNNRKCAGPDENLLCVRAMPAGKSCAVDPYWICEESLKCENHVCVVPEMGNCSQNEDHCSSGLICAGSGNLKRCVRPVGEGHSCGSNSFQICETGLNCANDKCVRPQVSAGGNCSASKVQCKEGTVCVGKLENMRCVVPMEEGKQCGQDPYWVCKGGLVCSNGLCIANDIPKGGDCLNSELKCEAGTVCAGTGIRMRCVVPMGENEICGKDPFWVCESNLSCIDNSCIKKTVRKGGSCLSRDSVCIDGTVCAGRPDKKRCVKPMSEGERCGKDPFWICQAGLECLENRCVHPRVSKGGDCFEEGSVCEEGTVCAGTASRKKCVTPMDEGQKCGRDPFWVCKAGFSCKNGVCNLSSGVEGADCKRNASRCGEGLVCAGNARKRKCVKPIPLFGHCGINPRVVCERELVCVNGRCVKIAQIGESCGASGTLCTSKAVCDRSQGFSKCVPARQEGQKCELDSSEVCVAGLKCVEGKCTNVALQIGDSCLPEGSDCPAGSVCVGDYPSKQCVKTRSAGRRCGRRWWQVCGKNLKCEGRRCVHASL